MSVTAGLEEAVLTSTMFLYMRLHGLQSFIVWNVNTADWTNDNSAYKIDDQW